MTGRGLQGRRRARLMLFTAFFIIGLEVLLFVAAPAGCMCPMFSEPPSIWSWVWLPAIGVAAQALGLVWMIRIYRADPEAAPSSFRATRR